MSYQVLARKYRPALFSEMVGQEHVLQALINALDQNRLHHAYLFTGTRGVGKTTIARILAKCLNCETGLTSTPCGECGSCREITEGRSMDLIEVDAASRTGVDDTRELLDNVQYLPTKSRYKVYLIDEVHMFSKSSFNALLKTLEEPPEHVKFLLATTDPKKLPVTVLSRCLQLNLRNMTPEKIVAYLKTVLAAEQVDFEEPALWQLGKAANGSMRDALSLTDQAIAHGNGVISSQNVINMLGGVDQREVYRFLEALLDNDASGLLGHIREVAQYSPDYSALLADLLSLLHRLAVAQEVPDAIDNSLGDLELVTTLANRITPEDIHLYYQIGLIGQRDLPLSPDLQTGFEMTLMRMLTFRPQSLAPAEKPSSANIRGGKKVNSDATGQSRSGPGAASKVAGRPAGRQPDGLSGNAGSALPGSPTPGIAEMLAAINGSAGGSEPGKKSEQGAVATQHKSKPVVQRSRDPLAIDTRPVDSEPGQATRLLKDSPVTDTVKPDLQRTESEQAASESAAEKMILELLSQGSNWAMLLTQLDLSGVALNLASNCHYDKLQGNRCVLTLSDQHASLWSENYEERIAGALSSYFDRPLTVKIQVGVLEQETPAQFRERQRWEQLEDALVAIKEDENIKILLNDFDGVLVTESVRPI